MKKTPLACLAAALLASPCGWSMDLREAFDAALAQDAQLAAVRANTAAAEEKVPQAKAQLLPQITAGFSANRNSLDSTAPNSLGQETTTHDQYRSGNRNLSLRQPLFRKQSWAGYQQAQVQVQDARALLEHEMQSLVIRVGTAYFDALLAVEQLSLVQAQKASTQAQLDAAQKALRAGSGTRTDIDQAQAKLDQTLANELEVSQNVDYTRRQLQNLVNQPPGTLSPLDAQRLLAQPLAPGQLDDWLLQAEKSNFEIQALQARVESARLELDKAQAGHYPTLDLVAQRSISKSENITRINTTYDSTSIGVQLNVPLYSGGYVNSTVRQATALLDNAQQQLESGRRDLASRVHKEYRGITEGLLRVRALEQATRSAEVALDSTRKSYRAGVRTLLDVLTAEQALTQSRQELAQARYMYLLAHIRLNALVGQASNTALDQINALLRPAEPAPGTPTTAPAPQARGADAPAATGGVDAAPADDAPTRPAAVNPG